MAKLTMEQKAIDAQIRRINRKIKAIADLGIESRQYQQIMTIFGETAKKKDDYLSWGTMSGEMTLRNKEGVLQLSRTKQALGMYSLGEYQKVLRQIDRLQSAAKAKKAMVKAFEQRTGMKARTKAEQAAAVAEEVSHYHDIQKRLEKATGELYRIEKERGIRFQAHSELQKKSKGRWTSEKTLQEMLDSVDAVLKGEDQRIVTNALEGW